MSHLPIGVSALWARLQRQVAFLDQPFVEGDAADHALDAVIADDHHPRVVGNVLHNFAQRAVDVAVVILHAVLQLRIEFVARMFFVEVFPEAVMDAVGAHLDHHEKIPRLVLQQPFRVGGVVVGHLEDAFEQADFVVGAEVFDVGNVLSARLHEFHAFNVAGYV